jgi:Kdo2-lipid IVA lauroyltransferase/acyltransferase
MYYIIYGFIKLLSFIPLPLLYLLGDFIYVLMFYVFKYRKQVVMNNLLIAFPEKTDAERGKIMKEFYHNLCDTFMEIIKLVSWNKAEIMKRFTGNAAAINEWQDTGRKVQVMSGHFFNWEMANVGVAAQCKLPFLGVYMPLSNKNLNKIFYDMRKKTGTILISATNFKKDMEPYFNEQYALILVADQNPGGPENAYWLKFFNKPAPFIKKPETGAKQKNAVIIYADFYKVKRGYYEFHAELVTANPNEFKDGELTKLLAKKVEDSIRKRPANYLWTHRRWKHQWKEEYGEVMG